MRYTVTMTIEAEDLSDAWSKAFIAFPSDLTPDSVKEAAENGLLSFCLNGGGREISASFLSHKLGHPQIIPGAIHPTIKRGFPE